MCWAAVKSFEAAGPNLLVAPTGYGKSTYVIVIVWYASGRARILQPKKVAAGGVACSARAMPAGP